MIVRFRVAGMVAEVELDTITGVEWRDMKRATGLHRKQLLADALVWEDFDAQAAFVWIALRQSRPDVGYEDVLGLFSQDACADDEPGGGGDG